MYDIPLYYPKSNENILYGKNPDGNSKVHNLSTSIKIAYIDMHTDIHSIKVGDLKLP